ncbi:MAG: amidinotransferase [Rhodospirillales bacterium]|jgi:N-dimethylarginine dimethylaminohydrolase|nr:amidinotransferase [Rhodospirillales bacterium]MBT4039815.1 amidinotransferase [Rhodospirillales bacterium]MBT4627553.1 amidinotransferase [Rhodospirillales bacterium]MBT5350575.1 amidinotransferase [Rhodospirillales bacterium]MBT5520303.1 amidinotransferase [Rhodospirillales bacterium]
MNTKPIHESERWGINNDYAPLHDVLLGKPDFYRWIDAGPLTKRTLLNADRTGAKFDLQLAQAQHAEMVRIYEDAGVRCHYLAPDEALHRNFFARDSNAMTPWGALICHMQLKSRRADYVTAIEFFQSNNIPIWKYATAGHFEGGDFVILEPGLVLIGYCGERSEKEGSEQVAQYVRDMGWEAIVAPIPALFVHMDGLVVPLAEKLLVACVDAMEEWLVDMLKSRGFKFVDVGFREAKALGVNLVALGNDRVLSMKGADNLNAEMRSLGFEVHEPDMSMFTLGGGGVHCLSQALCRDPA